MSSIRQNPINADQNAKKGLSSSAKSVENGQRPQHLPPLSNHYGSIQFADSILSGKPNFHSSPERSRNSSSGLLVSVPEDRGMDLERDTIRAHYSDSAALNDNDEDEDEDEEEWLLDTQLAREGLYRGSYKRIMAWYTLTPLTTILTFVFLVVLLVFVYPSDPNSSHLPYPYAPYLPYPCPEILTAAALWSMSQLLREFLYSLSAAACSFMHSHVSTGTTIMATTLQSISTVVLQLIAAALLLITPSPGFDHPTWHDHAFRQIWAAGLGWAAAEAAVGIKQGYEGIGYYRNVLVTAKKITREETSNVSELWRGQRRSEGYSSPDTISSTTGTPPGGHRDNSRFEVIEVGNRLVPRDAERQSLLRAKPSGTSKSTLEMEVENDLDQLIALKNREDMEEIYGIPLIYIPVFLSCLHRVNSVLMSLSSFLLISAAYVRSSFSPTRPREQDPFFDATSDPRNPFAISSFDSTSSNSVFFITLTVVAIFQLILAILHTAWILPKVGIQTFVYVSLLISLGMFFGGLGFWEALV